MKDEFVTMDGPNTCSGVDPTIQRKVNEIEDVLNKIRGLSVPEKDETNSHSDGSVESELTNEEHLAHELDEAERSFRRSATSRKISIHDRNEKVEEWDFPPTVSISRSDTTLSLHDKENSIIITNQPERQRRVRKMYLLFVVCIIVVLTIMIITLVTTLIPTTSPSYRQSVNNSRFVPNTYYKPDNANSMSPLIPTQYLNESFLEEPTSTPTSIDRHTAASLPTSAPSFLKTTAIPTELTAEPTLTVDEATKELDTTIDKHEIDENEYYDSHAYNTGKSGKGPPKYRAWE